MDVAARIRFQKYRGLKSFRTSVWDPKENLPYDYARIWQFENFDRTRKRVLSEQELAGECQLIRTQCSETVNQSEHSIPRVST